MQTTSLMIQQLEEWRKNPDSSEEQQFWKIVERFRADLVNQAFAILASQPDAEDVAQETLVTAFLKIKDLRDPKLLGNWLRKINHNRALEQRQNLQRQRRLAEDAGKEIEGFLESHTQVVTQQEMVAKAIDALPDELRAVLVLRYWESLEYQGIAQRLGIPLGTVKSRLARADRELEKKLRMVVGLDPVSSESAKAKRQV